MGKVIAIVGKPGSRKTWYAKSLMKHSNAVLLSNDEVLHDLFSDFEGKDRFKRVELINNYLLKKTCEIVRSNIDVILDLGFWKEKERDELKNYFVSRSIIIQFHYLDVDDYTWYKHIEKRNNQIANKTDDGTSFFLDQNIIDYSRKEFEVPDKKDIEVWLRIIS